jgi:hypothetical protein
MGIFSSGQPFLTCYLSNLMLLRTQPLSQPPTHDKDLRPRTGGDFGEQQGRIRSSLKTSHDKDTVYIDDLRELNSSKIVNGHIRYEQKPDVPIHYLLISSSRKSSMYTVRSTNNTCLVHNANLLGQYPPACYLSKEPIG